MPTNPAENSTKTVGRPFKKGVSGNPGGRPRTPEWFKENSRAAQDKILALMNCGDAKVELQAATLILAYSFGKPTEHVKLEASDDLAAAIKAGRERIANAK